MCVIYSTHFTFVVDTDIEFTALRIGKAAQPLDIFITPRFFVLNILILVIHTAILLIEENPTVGDVVNFVVVRLSVSDEVGYRIDTVILCSLEIVFHLCAVLHIILV